MEICGFVLRRYSKNGTTVFQIRFSFRYASAVLLRVFALLLVFVLLLAFALLHSPALLHASALSYQTRLLAQTDCCYLTITVTAATSPFPFCCRCLPVCIAADVAREPHQFFKYFKIRSRFSKIK
ncbi:hypothetical protein [Methanimicrococcus blatticola]|uniref:Uncharacterized protein n=1 Tax=Methanimicrococcus blatticola TaxID=91560 RepID=A0A484F9B0_9EURY|nr:hypothetical protein [Methanimicrococcus blatticola]MBZ3935176.1 hypothetical protein [Methanimicrococcus blatticola]MCC2508727.1 hypothetical protein [Methanimicrococcus blatticola]TDQ71237.1 hypothetical protein C7391_0342 [Methanimicrococcus blatticola]